MSPLDHLPSSLSTPHKNPLSLKLLAALAIALTACDKPQAPVVSEAPAPKAPSGRLVETLAGTTVEQRQTLVQKVFQKTLGETGGDFYTRGFPYSHEDLVAGSIIQLDVGFGPLGGIHVVTAKQNGGKTYREELVDHNKDGAVDFSDRTVSWSVRRDDMSPPMTHFQSNRTIDPGVQDDFATALQTALHFLDEEKQAKQK